jgi:cytochrome b
MTRVLVWDLPTRLFHLLLSSGFIAAAVIALWLGENSRLFPYHSIIGLTIALMICLRVVWGLVGTRYARFSSFVFGPRAVLEYMKGVLFGTGKRHIGHNPGSAYAIFVMLALVLALAATGILMGQGNKVAKELHEILAYIMVGVVIVHILGVVIHTLRRRENIIASMIHGQKDAEPGDAIRSSHPVVALVFLTIAGAWAFGLIRNFDPINQTTRLQFLGVTLQLGEAENEGGHRNEPGAATNEEMDEVD